MGPLKTLNCSFLTNECGKLRRLKSRATFIGWYALQFNCFLRMGPVLKPSWYVNPRKSNFDSIVSISPSRYKFLGCCTTLTKWVDIWWYVSAAITPPLQYHGAPLLLTDILSYMNLTFTLCFTVECILKLISYGPGVNLTLFVAVFLSLCQCVKTVFTCQCIHICVSFSHQIFPMCRSWPAPLVKNKKCLSKLTKKFIAAALFSICFSLSRLKPIDLFPIQS